MEDIRDKIRKLLSVAEGGANEHESNVAMRMASDLMMRHGIDRASLASGEERVEVIEGEKFNIDYSWHKILATSAGELYGVLPLGTSDWSGCRFVGRADNVGAASDTFEFLRVQVEQLYKTHLPAGMTKASRALYRRTFKASCSTRVLERCLQIVAAQCASDPGAKNALVVLDHRKQLANEVSAFMASTYAGGIVETKPRESKLVLREPDGYMAGRRAGDHVHIHRGVK